MNNMTALQGGSFIQVGLMRAGQPRFARITPAHLEVFGIPPEFYGPLYGAWLELLQVFAEQGVPDSYRDEATALHSAIRLYRSDIGHWDCYRWVMLMAVVSDLGSIEQMTRKAG